MASPAATLKDETSRRSAIADHGKSYLVEAGAGSGKTAIMAGRVAMLLAGGVAPKSIAAVTFTEMAASELLSRVRDFVSALLADKVPTELKACLPDGLSAEQRQNLVVAAETYRRDRLHDHPRLLPTPGETLSRRGEHRPWREGGGQGDFRWTLLFERGR